MVSSRNVEKDNKDIDYFLADSYSFGVILKEIFSGKIPQDEETDLDDCPDILNKLIKQCCSTEITRRPLSSEISKLLSGIDFYLDSAPWHNSQILEDNRKWETRGEKTPYRSLILQDGNNILFPGEVVKVHDLKKFNGEEFIDFIKKIELIDNPKLIHKFETHREVYEKRFSDKSELFRSESWKQDHQEERTEILKSFKSLVDNYSWNKGREAVVIPMLQGTSQIASTEIAQTGSALISSRDAGFYGRGIYWTSHLKYALYYTKDKPDP